MVSLSSGDVGMAVCAALGLDAGQVRGLTLRVYVDEIVTATVEFAPSPEQVKQAAEELRRLSCGMEPFDTDVVDITTLADKARKFMLVRKQ